MIQIDIALSSGVCCCAMAEGLLTEKLTKPKSQTPNAPAARRLWLVAAIAIVSLACFSFPQATFNQTLDPSWASVLVYAHQKGLAFGRDIVCTYGPLGFLSIEFFSPFSPAMRTLFEILFGAGIATGICLLAWRMTLAWRLVLLAFFIFATSPLHWGGDGLYVDVGLFAWGMLCFVENGRRLPIFVAALVILAAVGALIKNTFLVTGFFTIALVGLNLFFRKRALQAAVAVIGFIVSFLLVWMLSGQQLSSLAPYFVNSYRVMNGYNAAMGLDDIKLGWVLAMAAAGFAAISIGMWSSNNSEVISNIAQRLTMFIWLSGFLFEQWKYGCVRRDFDHVVEMLGMVPLMAISMDVLKEANKKAFLAGRVASILCIGIALAFLQSQVHSFVPVKLAQHTGKNIYRNMAVLFQPGKYWREKTEEFNAQKKLEQLPKIRSLVGNSPVDIFGQNQAFAMFNDFNYRPRPVFQSYAAYNRPMMELNERFYSSADAPEYVLFNLQALDGRYAPLEDSFILRDFLSNYEMVSREADYLLLQKRRTQKIRTTLLKEGTAALGEKIDLHNYHEEHLWIEIELEPTLFDRSLKFLYKPRETELVVWNENSPVKFRAPSAMLSAGFVASPLLQDNNDVLKFYSGARERQPQAIAVQLASGQSAFSPPQIHFRLYRLEK
ncbi:MAG TPA: hypothetical protein VFB72_09695 [Verrucomicrobiae bacterium]|nr:hypothetical protein [Verrucomicrobiae bacterium]